jgi:hypothetical protein
MIYAVLISLVLVGVLPVFSLAVLPAALIHMDIARRAWGRGYEVFSGYVIKTAIGCRIVDVGLASILAVTGLLNIGYT